MLFKSCTTFFLSIKTRDILKSAPAALFHAITINAEWSDIKGIYIVFLYSKSSEVIDKFGSRKSVSFVLNRFTKKIQLKRMIRSPLTLINSQGGHLLSQQPSTLFKTNHFVFHERKKERKPNKFGAT